MRFTKCVYTQRLGVVLVGLLAGMLYAESGRGAWLRYPAVAEGPQREPYRQGITEIILCDSLVNSGIIREEMQTGLSGLLGRNIPFTDAVSQDGAVVIGTPDTSTLIDRATDRAALRACGGEGYIIQSTEVDGYAATVIAANTPSGVLYGVFDFLRRLQTSQPIASLSIRQTPRIQRRLLNHWDNLDGSVERGYAGASIWQWPTLPDDPSPRIREYARLNASIGINGVALNNVNTQAEILRRDYLEKVAAIADIFRPYGIRVYLSVKFTSPVEVGGLDTSDPLDPAAAQWWKDKATEIYGLVPDFGGFLIKAFSEGQPGPQQYGRTHADGANVLAAALAPHGGVVMWRSFVYELTIDPDRTKCAYLEFVPLDGAFASNVFVQTKNGPIDFQPREPFNPLFGAMPKTPLMMELQITQEYTGQARHLVYLAPQWKEVLDADTWAHGPGTTVATIIDGSADGHALSGIAGVSGVGTDENWTGHHFSQANWYAFGRLAWDYTLTAEAIADEWIRMTWSSDARVVNTLAAMMAGSWEACVHYTGPLGLHHLMAESHHYGPQPDLAHRQRFDWTSVYYHRADAGGIGFDRTTEGSDAVSQYHPPLRQQFNSPQTCPEKYLLWFHRVPWDYRVASGRTLWEEMQTLYSAGVESVRHMQTLWQSLRGAIDDARFEHVQERLAMQLDSAVEWRDVCLAYFGQFAKQENKE